MARIPTTQALRALDSFTRHGTVWQAAEELNLTRSAVSHQLRLLERDLGFRMFDRVGTRIALTAQGQAYAGDIGRALAAIAASAARNAGKGAAGRLVVSCTPGFAATWLCPKIGRFRMSFPDIALSIVTPRRLDDVSNPDADLFIAFGRDPLPGVAATMLKKVEFTPLCAPSLINRLGGMVAPRDVLRAGLLHLHDHEDWRSWFLLAGVEETGAATGTVFADMNLVYAAAMNGQGIAMGDAFICREAMEAGALIRPFDIAIRPDRAYFLAVPPQKEGAAAVVAFRDWLTVELQREAR